MRCPGLLAAITLLAALPALAEEPGNLWQITTSMEGAGMKMPGRTQRVCVPADAEGPQAMAPEDNRCKMSDIQRSPNRFTYKVSCPEGSGTGEMTYQGKDSYRSVMTMTMDGDTMKMVSEGKRLGACDASQAKKQVAAIEAQANAAMQQSCGSGSEQMIPGLLTELKCADSFKKQLCDRFGARAGFRTVAQRQPTGQELSDSGTLPRVASYCGVQPDALRERLCTDASRVEDLDFIGAECPALAQPIAQRECAGRGFTSPPAPKYRDFCRTYAGTASPAAAPAAEQQPATPTGKAKDALSEGAKKLKGLFGR